MDAIRGSRAALAALLIVAALGLAGAVSPAAAQAPEGATEDAGATPPTGEGPARTLLDSIRDDLAELRFEEALAGIEAFLARPGTTEAERAEALVLRAQTHVAFGDLDAAEGDYAEILRMRPGYRPDSSLTPKKAMDRFDKVRAATVGSVRLTVDPPEAEVAVDGAPVEMPGDGELALRAGEHEISARAPGHDPARQTVEVAAGDSVDVGLRLVPNARTVIVRTVPPGVEVLVDGQSAGTTHRPTGRVDGGGYGELVLDNLPLGEHTYALRRECYREERLRDVLSVDMLDRAPKLYQTVVLKPARSSLVLRGAPDGATVRVDGERIGAIPLAAAEVCPGERRIEISRDQRLLWRSVERFEDGREQVVDVTPRPNAVLVGLDRWPEELVGVVAAFNRLEPVELPAGVDLGAPAGWGELRLPADADVALTVLHAERAGAPDRRLLFSPILRRVVALDRLPDPPARPTWQATAWGLTVADTEVAGPALVVRVVPGGPARAAGLVAGDRLVALGGREVADAAQVEATLAVAAAGRPIAVSWDTSAGERRDGSLVGAAGPRLVADPGDDVEAAVRAAWAVVDGAVLPAHEAAAPLANLALLFSTYGHDDLAVATWRRVDFGERRGLGEGTARYYLGAALQRAGDDDGAAQALRQAADSRATAIDDDGPPVAPAARDRLRDLGQGGVSAR